MKTLYTFNVDKVKEVEVEESVKNETTGETTLTKVKKEEKTPIEFIVKKPSRAEKEEADCVRAEYLSKYIRRGIISEAILSKQYADQGGILDEFQIQVYNKLNIDLAQKTEEYRLIAATEKEDTEKTNKLLYEILDLRERLQAFLQQQNVYYENTAESRARFKLIEYLFTHLVYFRADPSKEFEPFFKGESFEEKLAYLEELEENEDQVLADMKEQALLVLSVFVRFDMAATPETLKAVLVEQGVTE